jgi:hypothetical protein
MSSTITGVRRTSVIHCRLRGVMVEIIFSNDDLDAEPVFLDAITRQVLDWKLTPMEARDLDCVVTEHYQPRGVR